MDYDFTQFLEVFGGGIAKLKDYIEGAFGYINDTLMYLPSELGQYVITIAVVSVIFLILGRSSNHG